MRVRQHRSGSSLDDSPLTGEIDPLGDTVTAVAEPLPSLKRHPDAWSHAAGRPRRADRDHSRDHRDHDCPVAIAPGRR